MAKRKIKYYVSWSELTPIFSSIPHDPKEETRVKFLIYSRDEVKPEERFYKKEVVPHEYYARSIEVWWDPKKQEWTFECADNVIITS